MKALKFLLPPPSVLIAILCVISCLARAEIVFDSSGEERSNFYPSLAQYGDEIHLKPDSARVVTDFLFEFFGDFEPTGGETARIRFYENDGPGMVNFKAPGTVLYDSGDFTISSGYRTQTITGLQVLVPDFFTWTVEFGGLTGTPGNRAGLLLNNAPTIGKSFRDFWLKSGETWTLFRFPNFSPPAYFAARVIATEADTTPNIPASPNLAIRRDSDDLVLEWTGAAVLQKAEAAIGPYEDVTGASTPYRVTLTSLGEGSGFWRLRIGGVPEATILHVRKEEGKLILEWTGNGALQVANDITGPYSDVIGATSPHQVELLTAARMFWRLKR